MVEDVFPGLPASIKAAVKIGEFYYMFKDKMYPLRHEFSLSLFSLTICLATKCFVFLLQRIYKFDLKANKVVQTGGSWAACQPSNLNSTAQITKAKPKPVTTKTTTTTTTTKPETTKKKKWYHKLLD